MTLEILRTKEELRNLIDDYAYLGDEKKISEQMQLFTPDIVYTAFMNGVQVSTVTGRDNMEAQFDGHVAAVKTYFTLNGQQTVKIDGDTATGVSFTQIKMVREAEGKEILTDYSVKYEDKYALKDGKWLIKERVGYFIIVEARPLNN